MSTDIKQTRLFRAMKETDDYDSDEAIVGLIQEMREQVKGGSDPEELLFLEGFEPDFIEDLL